MLREQTFEVVHHEFPTDRPFDDVVGSLEAATGDVQDGVFARELGAVVDAQDFQRRMHAREADSGFMRFFVIDHGAWMAFTGRKARCRLYAIGNPLVAEGMMGHDVGAGLNVPVRLMVHEAEDGEVRVSYDVPSSLMSRLGNADVTDAARSNLDVKLRALAERITG